GLRAEFTDPLTILMWTVGLILLMACANVAGLLLGRANARQKEISLRRALGARSGRILRQLLTESLLLSAIGGVFGLGVGWLTARALLALIASANDRPMSLHASLDLRVLLFALGASVATGVVFGLAPALRASRGDLQASLKAGVGNSAAFGARRRLRLGNGLVVVQIALCMVVLAGAGLLVRSLVNLRSVNPGFDTGHVLLFALQPELIGYKGAAVDRLYQGVQERIVALPGVRGVSFSESPLLSGDLSTDDFHIVAGGPSREVNVLPVGLNFFATMKLPLPLGRDFVPSDFVPEYDAPDPAAKAAKKTSPEAIIVNEAFVRKYLGPGNPIGRVFGIGDQGATGGWKIVGVAGDARYQGLRDSVAPTVYTPSSEGYATFEVRTAGDPMAALASVRQVVHAIDANLPLSRVSTQARNIDQTLFGERLMADLSSCLGALALLLACIGLYGLLAQEVTRRTREIGIRMALGARRGQVLRMVLGFGAALGGIGLGLGMAGAWAATRYLHAMLFDVGATDPVTLAAVALLLFVVSLAACLIPARRATRVEPLEALRYE
ncbi:MAG TPA: FtsX-like permease family protein, partial [Terriglobales bacterium]